MRSLHGVVGAVALSVSAIACSDPTHGRSQVTPKVVIGDIPCAPDKVLKHVCQHCHSSPPQHEAPFPLVTYSDINAEMDGHPLYYFMEKYVSAGDMPLPPVEITDADRATLLSWLRAGAPARPPTESCDVDAAPPVDSAADTGADEDAAADVHDAFDAPTDSAIPSDAGCSMPTDADDVETDGADAADRSDGEAEARGGEAGVVKCGDFGATDARDASDGEVGSDRDGDAADGDDAPASPG